MPEQQRSLKPSWRIALVNDAGDVATPACDDCGAPVVGLRSASNGAVYEFCAEHEEAALEYARGI